VQVVCVDLASRFRLRSMISRAVVASSMWEGRNVAPFFDELIHTLQPISQLVDSTGSTALSVEKGHVNKWWNEIAYTRTFSCTIHLD
jgi:hypothetical protein